jgi:hypothetical protein
MLVPSNAMPSGSLLTAKVPRGPQVVGALELHEGPVALQAPPASALVGANGARQSGLPPLQMLHGPVAQLVFDEQSHCTVVVAEVEGHAAPPSGIAPSPTVSVSVMAPAVVHVKLVVAELGAENVPLGADHA